MNLDGQSPQTLSPSDSGCVKETTDATLYTSTTEETSRHENNLQIVGLLFLTSLGVALKWLMLVLA